MIRPQTLKACRFAIQRILTDEKTELGASLRAQLEETLAEANEDWSALNTPQRDADTVTQLLNERLLISAPESDVEPLIRVLQVGLEAIRHGGANEARHQSWTESRRLPAELSRKFRSRVLRAGGNLLRSLTGGQ